MLRLPKKNATVFIHARLRIFFFFFIIFTFIIITLISVLIVLIFSHLFYLPALCALPFYAVSLLLSRSMLASRCGFVSGRQSVRILIVLLSIQFFDLSHSSPGFRFICSQLRYVILLIFNSPLLFKTT